MESRVELKNRAKNILDGRRGKFAILAIVPMIFDLNIQFSSNIDSFRSIVDKYTPFGAHVSVRSNRFFSDLATFGLKTQNIITDFISMFFIVAIMWVSLDLLRRKKDDVQLPEDLFLVGKNFVSYLAAFFMQWIYLGLWSLLFLIPGIVKSYSYAMTYYVLKDGYEVTGKMPSTNEAITRSRELMYGHKWELFILDLSFIPWRFLSLITLGVGSLWVTPYVTATKAAFYENLVREEDPVLEEAEELEF
ncbi:MAG: DUF975 family protein [Lactobacillales bacterium]|jgi:uncharacterized membrane protein|nr:DUF975 family protein [Lactobacillales bacterium]